MNPATALARVLVDELARGRVTDVVLAPGSRSAPLALALADADAAGLLRLHVRIDERSAGFLAVGLAVVSGRPVPVVCTSGTAVANLHPAVLEARHAHVGLLLLTADRPPELRGTGANQTVDQVGFFGSAVRGFVELGVPTEQVGAVTYWRSAVSRALASAVDGPVHINLALREPLVPDGDDLWCEPSSGRPERAPWTAVTRATPIPLSCARPGEDGVIVVGHGASGAEQHATRALAEGWGWPLLSEPTGNARCGRCAIATYPLLLTDEAFRGAHQPGLVVVVGKPGLSRSLLAWLRGAERMWVVDPHDDWADPTRTASAVLPAVPVAADAGRCTGEGPAGADGGLSTPDSRWLAEWLAADRAARAAIDQILDCGGTSEPRLARDLMAALPDGALLLAGSSRPIRDLEAYAGARDGVRVVGNRGASGIDGLVSAAVGAALAHEGPAYALLGDLAFLHDANGLVLGPDEPRPDLTLVVVDNDGGGIFGTLEQAREPGFERVFGTPHGVALAGLCSATGTTYRRLDDLAELPAALCGGTGLRVLHVRTDRSATAELHSRLQTAVSAALAADLLTPGPE